MAQSGSIEDRLAILDAIARYAHAWDDRDADTYADCFTDDAVFEAYIASDPEPHIRKVTKATILEWARGAHAGHLADRATKHTPNGTVFDELGPDAARTRTMLLETVMRPEDGRPWLTNTGVYVDAWRRTPEGWKLARREMHHDRSQAPRPMDSPRATHERA